MSPQTVRPLTKDGEAVKNPWVSHFWFVNTSDDEAKVNMDLAWLSEKVGNVFVDVPSLTNSKDVKRGDMLLRLKTPETPEPAYTTKTSEGPRIKKARNA